MILLLLLCATGMLAYSNGANDNFKGVASLLGSRTTSYRTAIVWATLTTAAGSAAAIFLAQGLLRRFSGQGLVREALIAQPEFLLAIALGAAGTVAVATLLGFPISTTHSLTGALVGAGLVMGSVNFAALGRNFVTPLLLSPILAVLAGGGIYSALHQLRVRLGIGTDSCLCLGTETILAPRSAADGVMSGKGIDQLTVTAGPAAVCQQRYTGAVFGVQASRAADTLHFLSAGAVSFARGLNDTPKIAGLLLVVSALDVRWSMLAVALAIAIGGLLNARRVAETMAHRITGLNPGQGLAANLATALLVNTASFHGLPVSTTHVSVGSLLGIGLVTNQVRCKPVVHVLLAWILTLPCAALLAAVACVLLRPR